MRALTVRHADRRQRVVRQLDIVEDRDRLGDAVSLGEQLGEPAVAELVAARLGDRLRFEDLDRDRVLDRPRRERQVLRQEEARRHRARVVHIALDHGVDAVGVALEAELFARRQHLLDLLRALGGRLDVATQDGIHLKVVLAEQLRDPTFTSAPEDLHLEQAVLGLREPDAVAEALFDLLLVVSGREDVRHAHAVVDDANARYRLLFRDGAGNVVGVR